MDTDQTSIIHGKACTKHSSVSLEPEAPINLHSSVKKCDTSSHVPREVVVAREDCGESECCNGTGVFVVLQGCIVLKHTAAAREGERGRGGEGERGREDGKKWKFLTIQFSSQPYESNSCMLKYIKRTYITSK